MRVKRQKLCGPEKTTSCEGNRLEFVGRAPRRPNHSLGQPSEVLGGSVSRLTGGSRHFVEVVVFEWPAAERAQAWCQRCWTHRCGKVFVRLRTASTHWNVPRKCGPHGELFFFRPCVSCSLIGLHIMSDGDSSLELRHGGGMAAQKSPVWSSGGSDWQEVMVRLLLRITNTTWITSLLKSLGKIGQVKWVSLVLQDWEFGRVALSCHMAMDLFMPRNGRCVLGELKVVTVPEQLSCGTITAKKPFSQHERAVTFKERDVLRENEGRRNGSDWLKV